MRTARVFLKTLTASMTTVAIFSSANADVMCGNVYRNTQLKEKQQAIIKTRYGVDPAVVDVTPGLKLPVILRMDGHESLAPKIPKNAQAVREIKKYDVTVVGGGPAGLTAALYLAEAGKSVLILERNEKAGGLAFGSELKGIRAGGGAAYSAGPDGGLQYSIFRKIGLGNYKKKLSIEEPIDSYLWKGKLYKGIWEEHTLHELPASFSLFKHALLKMAKKGANDASTPIGQWADNMDMAVFVRQMPEAVSSWGDKKSKEIFSNFVKDKSLDQKDPMKDVIELLDLYGRSALGGIAKEISARQFVDFYESEIYTRFTGTLGTGTITEALLKKIAKYKNLIEIRTSAPVASIENLGHGTNTKFLQDGVLREVVSDDMIFAAPMALAPKLIKGLAERDPEKVKIISETKMTDYAVHVVRLKGHPFRATYDTWAHSGGDNSKPTDYILGRWQDPKIQNYHGMREFQKDPVDDYGVISIYQPLGAANAAQFTKDQNLKMVDDAVKSMLDHLNPLVKQDGQKIEIELVESFRWPYSIHVVSPGYAQKTPILARPDGNIHFANNTVAAPELESAMERAVLAVREILNERNKQRRASGD